MLETASRVEALVQTYVRILKTKGILVDHVFLFGSQSRGTATPESDIDVIIVSPTFSGMPFWRRWEVLGDALAEILEPIEVLSYAPEEFEAQSDKPSSFLRYVLDQKETVRLCL